VTSERAGTSEARGSKFIGRAMKRVEDPRLIKGAAIYVDDVRLPGMLHAAVVRSPYAHARITGIDTSAAKAVPGVTAVLTGADVNDQCGYVPCGSPLPGMVAPKHTVLAGDRVYFVGHPVAVVIASDPYVARDASELIDVDYDPLPVVADPEAALHDGAALTHPELGTNVAFNHHLSGGDIDAAFKNADRVVKQRMVHQRLTPMPIEPRGVVASYNAGEDSLTIWTSTQIPHLIRLMLPDMIGVPENKLRIIAPEVGGGFGAKLNVYAEEALCAHLAKRLNAPIKWIESRRDNAAATIHGRDQIGEYEVAVKNDGTILGLRARAIADLGSYLQLNTPAIPTLTGLVLSGCYKIPAVQMDIVGVYTNKMATDAYRGAGRPEATYLIERLMDLIAAEVGVDRVELRRRHFPQASEFPFKTICGLTYDSGNYEIALSKAQELVSWNTLLDEQRRARAAGRLFGIGLSTYVEICAMGPSKAMSVGGWEWASVRLDLSGTVTVVTGVTPHGQGQETSFTQIAADRLGVTPANIVILHGDTNVAQYGRDTYGSRATAVGGTAIIMCIDKIIAKARVLAAHLLDAPLDDVEFANGRFAAKGSDRSLGWAELANEAYVAKNLPSGFEPGLESSSFFEPANFTFPFGTHIVAVEIERQTGAVSFKKYVAVDDCGPQINPLLVEGQLQGGIAQALGQVMMERTIYDENGQLLTGEFMDYAIPRAEDIPEYVLDSTETPSPSNPMGIKGVGEAGTIGATPAIANAIIDALSPLGVKHLDLPLTPQKLWTAISSARS
jgi:carbon-monoxide dehydrogenase large subunit